MIHERHSLTLLNCMGVAGPSFLWLEDERIVTPDVLVCYLLLLRVPLLLPIYLPGIYLERSAPRSGDSGLHPLIRILNQPPSRVCSLR